MSADALDWMAQRALAPFDAVRASALRALGPALGPLMARPAMRHAVLGGTYVVLAFALTALAPIVLLALAPLALGLPHLVADIRYLLVSRGLHQRLDVWLLVLTPLVLVLALSSVTVAGVVTIGAATCARGRPARRLMVAATGTCLIWLGLSTGRAGTIIFAHLHHAIALALWWSMTPRRGRLDSIVPALALLGVLAIAVGALDACIPALLRSLPDALRPEALVASLSPAPDSTSSLRWVLAFAFGQSVHYLVWLRMIPDDRRGRPAPRPFLASYRALRSQLGAPLLLVAAGLALALLAWGAVDLAKARDGYLALALFHGPLEVAAAGLAFAERRSP